MRLFVAVDVPEPSDDVRAGTSSAPAHLTLAFLGEVDPDRVPALLSAVDRAAGGAAEFEFALHGMGAFPSAARPRVVWVGVRDGREALERLALRVRAELGAAGFPVEERPFVPHLTVLRVRGPEAARRARELVERHAERPFARGEVSEVLVKSSTLAPGGARHEVLHRSPLSRRGPGPSA